MTTKPSITTHVLDVACGKPVRGLPVRLARREGETWRELASGVTDESGRFEAPPEGAPLRAGAHRLLFETGRYLRERHGAAFYPEVTVVFDVVDTAEHYHVPLLLGPFGYTTYRGS